MNVYNFDFTIYNGDSVKDFYWHCLKNQWSLAFYWPGQALTLLKYRLGRINQSSCEEGLLTFLKGISDLDGFVYDFWRHHIHKIKHFYQVWQKPDDLIIAAAPEFLLAEACRRLGVNNLIASRVEPGSGKYQGPACRGKEKLRRFKEEHGDKQISSFFSASLTDRPLAKIAKTSYLVKEENLLPWPGLV